MTDQAYSGMRPVIGNDELFEVWWRHKDQRQAQYIKDMTLDEVRGFALGLLAAADEFDTQDSTEETGCNFGSLVQ